MLRFYEDDNKKDEIRIQIIYVLKLSLFNFHINRFHLNRFFSNSLIIFYATIYFGIKFKFKNCNACYNCVSKEPNVEKKKNAGEQNGSDDEYSSLSSKSGSSSSSNEESQGEDEDAESSSGGNKSSDEDENFSDEISDIEKSSHSSNSSLIEDDDEDETYSVSKRPSKSSQKSIGRATKRKYVRRPGRPGRPRIHPIPANTAAPVVPAPRGRPKLVIDRALEPISSINVNERVSGNGGEKRTRARSTQSIATAASAATSKESRVEASSSANKLNEAVASETTKERGRLRATTRSKSNLNHQ